jgi:trehalose 6-phosphate synthase/phosphatase
MYQRADVAFIAPFRDGMNLVAKEYLASQQGRDGVLVLSQTAGAAAELKEAIQVDPTKPKTLVHGLRQALTLPKTELRQRASIMRRHLRHFTVQHWADSFMNDLQQPRIITLPRSHTLNDAQQQKLIGAYHGARRRLLLLDYDGVLRAFERTPAAASPSRELIGSLRRLARTTGNDVVIVSGRGKADLDKWFGTLPLALAAEHGALFRRKGGKNWHKTTSSNPGWRHPINILLKYYADKTPGAFIEQKEWATVWHYRTASPYQAQKHLVALRRVLKPIAKEYGLQVLEGHKVLEVRPIDVHKGRVVQEWLTNDYDFVLAIGDDTTDEDMFVTLSPGTYTVKVGRGPTLARFRLKDVPAVLRLLNAL